VKQETNEFRSLITRSKIVRLALSVREVVVGTPDARKNDTMLLLEVNGRDVLGRTLLLDGLNLKCELVPGCPGASDVDVLLAVFALDGTSGLNKTAEETLLQGGKRSEEKWCKRSALRKRRRKKRRDAPQ
jgi:hypothetical protein